MSTPPIQYTGPPISPEVPWSISQHIQLLYQKLGNHAQAFQMQQAQIATIKAGATTTVVESGGAGGGGGGGGGTPSAPGIVVSNQSGVTSYTTQMGDNGALIVLSDASAIAVSLASQDPPWGAFVANIGAGVATLTPATGTINNAATLTVLSNSSAIIAFDGTNWWATPVPIVPVNTPAIAHEWLNSYNAATGVFTQTQPAFTDISGTATAAQVPPLSGLSGSVTPGQVPALSALTGQITESQLPSAGLTVTIVTAMLTPTGTEGSMSFTNGILTAQTPAT
jgi:hypothetical protein